MQEILLDDVIQVPEGYEVVPLRHGYAIRQRRDRGLAAGPQVPKPSAAKRKRRATKAARKRSRGAYSGQ